MIIRIYGTTTKEGTIMPNGFSIFSKLIGLIAIGIILAIFLALTGY